MQYDVIVVGVGAMGSATLAELAARGARVLGLERASVPNEAGSSHGVNRIIRLAYAEDPRYVPLLRLAYARWRALEARVGERLLYVTGGLDMGTAESDTVAGSLESCRTHGLEHELLEADAVMRRYPGFRLPRGIVAVAQPEAGFVMSERAIAGYAATALADGAELHGHEPVLDWEAEDGGVRVRTSRTVYRARRLVISAGAWVSQLVPALRRLAVPERQVLLWSQPRRPERFALGAFPVFILEVPEGRYYGFPVHAIPGVKIGRYHHRGEVVDPDALDRGHLEPEDEAVLRACTSRYLPDADGPTLSLRTCLFTNTPDEHFVIDTLPALPEVVVASPCSGHGFKFASAIGSVVADLALEGGTGQDIEMFRLGRFAEPERSGRPAAEEARA